MAKCPKCGYVPTTPNGNCLNCGYSPLAEMAKRNVTSDHDNVNNPSHYGKGDIEAIEYIEDFLTEEEYIGYLRGNIAKYLHRWRYKNGLEDLKKAQWYQNRLIQTMENTKNEAISATVSAELPYPKKVYWPPVVGFNPIHYYDHDGNEWIEYSKR